ncbi:hypothetical protein GJ744_007279 [Endocarpon pusillum]|uniref:Uncharacterized protein n=1 Tax=Endocarpon pusillum TaxID=364733 RepID=A0A8H7E683_9EURO|nr:hypothetical protein GJ744_007279 [Endocarpon pusillum]
MTASTYLARSSSLRLDDDDLFSSPDPLATSINDENSLYSASAVRRPKPSPRKHRTTKVLQDITLSTPQKARRTSIESSQSPAHYQSKQFLSPWKIRVTVEAEPEETVSHGVKSRSKTTIAPPRDTPSPTKQSGGRRRNRSDSRKSGRGRMTTGSPSRLAHKASGADQGRLTDLDTAFLEDNEKETIKPKRKQGNRKTRTVSRLATQDMVSFIAKSEEDPESMQSSSNRGDCVEISEAGRDSKAAFPHKTESPELRELDFNRISVRSRREPAKTAVVKKSENTVSNHEKHPTLAHGATRYISAQEDAKRHVSGSSAITYPTPDASVQDELEAHAPSSDATEERVEFDTVLESEGFTMIDLESLPSARHFVTSPDNLQHGQTEPAPNTQNTVELEPPRSVTYPVLAPPASLSLPSSPSSILRTNEPPPTPIPSYLAPPEEGESDLSSTVPSCSPAALLQHVLSRKENRLAQSLLRHTHTPLASAKSSPKLPSPPNQAQNASQLVNEECSKSTPPRLGQVVRAGIALQGLLSPKVRKPSLQPSPISNIVDMGKRSASTPTERLGDLFVGFDSGTRRELRAGLRFGEELAKRQRLTSSSTSSASRGPVPERNQHGWPEKDAACRGQTAVECTPVGCRDPTAAEAISCENRDLPISHGLPIAQKTATPFDANQTVGSIFYLDSEAREHRWQSEREAVSRQIENANASQVIVIDSDEEEDDPSAKRRASVAQSSPTKSIISEAEEDIWLAEAEDAQSSSRHIAEDPFPEAEQVRQRERAKEVVSKPRRSLIPSPWKRGEDVDSSFTVDGDVSGMFWQQPKAKERIRSFRRLSSNLDGEDAPRRKFDIGRMIGESSSKEEDTGTVAEGISYQPLQETLEHSIGEQSFSNNEIEAFEHEEDLVGKENVDAEIFEHKRDFVDDESFEPNMEVEAPSEYGAEPSEESSIPLRPIMIPVNFNDTTDTSMQSEDHVQDVAGLEPAPSSSCRPVTPRSAMKGSRASLSARRGSVSPTPRKVVFSRHSLCLDDDGMETSMQVRGRSLTPETSIESSDAKYNEVGNPTVEIEANEREAEQNQHTSDAVAKGPRQTASTSWFSRLTGWGSKAPSATCSASSLECTPRQQLQGSSKLGHAISKTQWEPTKTALPSTSVRTSNAISISSIPFSSYASDCKTLPSPSTLPVSGYFSDDHYKHLHILYLKSLKPTFTRPSSIRPTLQGYIGQKCYCKDGEFAWEFTGQEAEVVERWMRSFEGREAKEVVSGLGDGYAEGRYRKIGWDEWDLCMRLFSIVAGREVRKELKEKQNKACSKA